MSLIPNNCVEYDEPRPVCIAEEKGKKYTLQNDSRFRIQKIKVDGCLAQKEKEKRCDYLFKIEKRNPQAAIFVELKGAELIIAIRQVLQTIAYLHSELKNYELLVRIVGSRDAPQMKLDTAYRQLTRIIPPQNFKYATNCFLKETI